MNIFAVDDNPYLAAYALPDKLIVKMPLETAQMLSVVMFDGFNINLHKVDGSCYSTKAYKNHPCTAWARQSPCNLAWLISHGLGLCMAYTERYNKVHGCENAILEAAEAFELKYGSIDRWVGHTPFIKAMPDTYKVYADSVQAYRRYLNVEKLYATWTKVPPHKPIWYDDSLRKDYNG